MRIVGLMAWYDEPLELLAESVGSLAPYLDMMICVDGAYSHFPGGRAQSSPVQSEVITDALRAAGCRESEFVIPLKVWVDEVEKRSAMFAHAENLTSPEDWYIIWDADMVLERADFMRTSLTISETESASFMLRSGPSWIRHRMAHRAIRGLTVVDKHSVYGYQRRDGWHYVWGHQLAPAAVDLSDTVVVRHEQDRRPPARLAAKKESDQRGHRLEISREQRRGAW